MLRFMENEKEQAKCTSSSRCRNARGCEYCAAVRQQQIAGVAEKLEQHYGALTMTVLRPEQNTAAAVKAVHASFMRRALAPAGIWTVEQGTLFGGLHLNILSPQPLPARWKGECYSEVLRITARDAAAYISKREGMPSQQQYAGRLYGTFGKIGEILATQEYAPVVQAAALEVAMGGGGQRTTTKGDEMEYRTDEEEKEGWTEGAPVNGERIWWNAAGGYTKKPPRQNHSKELRAEIMRAHLPKLYEAVGRVVA